MPTVAPPAATASPLTGFASDAGATPAGTTDLFAGLFQAVLAQIVSQVAPTAAGQLQAPLGGDANATTNGADTAAGSDATTTDPLAELLATTDGDTTDTTVSPDLLSQLLASLGVNGQALAQLQRTGTDAPQLLATAVDPATGLATVALSPALEQVLARTGLVPQSLLSNATTSAAAPADPGANAPFATDLVPTSGQADVVPNASPLTVTPPAVGVASAVQTGGRIPAVVLQTPVVSDRAQQLPPAATSVEPDTIQPPVGEIPAVTAAPAVTTGQPVTGSQLPDIELPIPGTAIPAPAVSNAAFALPVTTDLTSRRPAPTQTAASLAPVVEVARTSVTSPTPQTGEPTRTPAAGILPAPGVAVTVVQPLSVSGSTLELSEWVGQVGLTQPVATPGGLPEKAHTSDSGSLATVGLPTAPRNNPAPVPVAAPAPAPVPATLAPSVAEQLNGPIVSHLQARTAEGETELRIRLDPPELGTVKLKIVSTGGEVRAELHVTSDAVRRVVEGQLPELWQKLDDAGVRVQRMDVTADSAGNSNAGTARDDRDGRWDGSTPPEPSPFVPVRPARTSAVRAAAGNRIDLTA